MNHLRARSNLSAFLDGELGERETEEIWRHLRTCPRCRREAEEFRLLRGMLASLSPKSLSEEGHRLIMAGLAEKVRQKKEEERRRKAALIPRVATAAAVLLALLAVTVAVMTTPAGKNSATMEGEKGNEDIPAVSGKGYEEAGPSASQEVLKNNGAPGLSDKADKEVTDGLLAAIPSPKLEYAGREYTAEQVSEYSADLGTRLDFFSRVWYPASYNEELIDALKQHCRDGLEEQARRLDRDAAGLMRALDTVEASIEGRAAEALPCFVEEASYEGRKAYIISYSRPEDSQLFNDRDLISLVNLIRLSSPDELMRSTEVQKELAASLTPPPRFDSALPSPEDGLNEAGLGGCVLGDSQDVLRMLASENNQVSRLREMSRLDPGLMLSAVFQELGSPLHMNSRLFELLTMRVWVVDAVSGEIILRPYR